MEKDTANTEAIFTQHKYYPKNLNDFIEHLVELIDRADDLIKAIKNIVICSPYLHAIRLAYVVLHKTRHNMVELLELAFNNAVTSSLKDDQKIIHDLINCINCGMRVFESMEYTQKITDTMSVKLENFGRYVTNLQATVSYLVHTVLLTTMHNYLKNTTFFKFITIKTFKCCKCYVIVTFNGCSCTDWETDYDITANEYQYLTLYESTNGVNLDTEVPVTHALQMEYLRNIHSYIKSKPVDTTTLTALKDKHRTTTEINVLKPTLDLGMWVHTRSSSAQFQNIGKEGMLLLRRPREPPKKMIHITSINEYIDHILTVINEAENLAFRILPIVICTPYQNAVRTTYIILKESQEIVNNLLSCAFNENYITIHDYISGITYKLQKYVNTGLKVYKAMEHIQNITNAKNDTINLLTNYIDELQEIIRFTVDFLLKSDLVTFLEENDDSSEIIEITRFNCRACKMCVTFNGCDCTDWKHDLILTEEEIRQLRSPVEDGPWVSKIELYQSWEQKFKQLKGKTNLIDKVVNNAILFKCAKDEQNRSIIAKSKIEESQKYLQENSVNYWTPNVDFSIRSSEECQDDSDWDFCDVKQLKIEPDDDYEF